MGESIKENWKIQSQPYELEYHKTKGINWCSSNDKFNEYWNNIKNWIGEVKGDVLDIGCGPRPPFEGYYIEPLANKYKEITPKDWWNNRQGYSMPAEDYTDRLFNMDYVICWNVLDHTYNWKNILENVKKYLKSEGKFILATDLRAPALGHPGFDNDEFFKYIKDNFEIIKEERNFSERGVCFILKKLATKENATEYLPEFIGILDKLEIKHMLDGGTLLGAYRDKDFCEDDHNDIDLTTLDKVDIDKLETEAYGKGYTLYHYWEATDKTTEQISFKKNGIKFDLMIKEIKEDFAWWSVIYQKKPVYKKVLAKFYQNTKPILFKGVDCFMPEDVEEYLELRYGDWKTPVHRKDYNYGVTDKCIVKEI